MAQFVDKVTADHHHRRSLSAPPQSLVLKVASSNTLSEIFDSEDKSYDVGTERSTAHSVVEIMAPSSSFTGTSASFILSFRDLCYGVRTSDRVSVHPQRKLNSMDPSDQESMRISSEGTERKEEKKGMRTKMLLNCISGEAKEGEILAILGASGSGKSTLIDALANRIARGSLRGLVTLNGEKVEEKMMKAISAYVMQDDLLFPMLTVEETLMFSAEFRLPSTLSHSKKKERVQTLIDQLGLRQAAKTIIGDEGHRGVSGGERRRVSIGTDIIHDPILLFLDEPTSGLDSTSAFMVVNVLKKIAESGSVVVMSIHQPSYRILGLLDRLIFLSHGQTVYSGSPDDIRRFFSEFGRPVPDNENRTEFVLDLVLELESSPEGTTELVTFNKVWQLTRPGNSPCKSTGGNGSSGMSLKETIARRGKLVAEGAIARSAMSSFANPFWIEMLVLAKRSFTNSRRLPELILARLGVILVTGFILATIFWQLDSSPKGVQERIGFFAFAMSTTFYTCAEALPVFVQERYIFTRETAYNAYRRSSYVLSNSIVDIPALVVLSIVFAATTFFAVGLAGGQGGFFFFFLSILASFWSGNSFVTFLSGIVTNVKLGYTVVVATLAYFLLFSGFFISRHRIPIYWIWFHYISLVKYPYEGVLHNEFGDPAKCLVTGLQIFDDTPLGTMSDVTKSGLLKAMSSQLSFNITAESCVTYGSDILRQQGITDLNKWNCVLVTVAWGFFFRILFYFSLLLGCKNKRK